MSANQRGINYSEAYINEERQIQQRTNGRDKSVKNSSTDRNIGATIRARFKGRNRNYALGEIGKGQKAKQSVEQTVTKERGAIKTLNKYNKKEIDNARLQGQLNESRIGQETRAKVDRSKYVSTSRLGFKQVKSGLQSFGTSNQGRSIEQTVTKECGAIKTLNKYNKKKIDNARLQSKLNGTGIERRIKVRSTNNVSGLGTRIKS